MGRNRIYSLDILRGLACTLVLIAHMPLNKGIDRTTPVWRFIELFRPVGWIGVDLFFVLSGLLISGLLFKEIQASGTVQLKRFWLRRGMKIWPAYYIMFGIWTAAALLYDWRHGFWPQLHEMASGIAPNLIFIQNYMQELQWPHTWSIAVEEHFYLALPVLLVFLLRTGKLKWLPAIIGVVAVAVLAMRIAMAASTGCDWPDIKYPTHLHIDALLFGVLLGYLNAFHSPRLARLRRWWPAAVIATVVMFLSIPGMVRHDNMIAYAIAFTPIYLIFGSLVQMATFHPDFGRTGPLPFRLAARCLATIGVYSYTIYLAHGIAFKFNFTRHIPLWFEHEAWKPGVFVVGSIIVGVLCSRLIERPFLKLRERWIPAAGRSSVIEHHITEKPMGETGAMTIPIVAIEETPCLKRAA